MNPVLHLAPTAAEPPVYWVGDEIEASLSAYIENAPVGNTPNSDWSLFQLGATSRIAQMVDDFETLLSLEHVQGFQPLPHQITTAERVLRDLRGRAILADEVGLGKTIEAGLIIKEYQLRGLARKVLILVPASLVLQWTRELAEKFRIQAQPQRNEWTWSQYDVVVASLDTAKREPHRTEILAQPWDLVVVDEAHKLKNSRTKNWQTVNEIPNKFLLLLTATPMQNQLQELHTLITLLKPGQLGSTQEFSKRFITNKRQPKQPEVLRESLDDVMIRNKRRDGGATLPPRHVDVVPLTLSPPERELYDAIQSLLRNEYEERKAMRISVLPLLTLQREICSSPYAAMISLEKMAKKRENQEFQALIAGIIQKAEQIKTYTKVEKVLEMLDLINGEKCIIFTEYRATQDFLMFMLKKRGIPAVPFRGGFKRGKKDWMKDLFSKKAQVLVATESGGEGINLQFCHHMINFDLPWNPMRLEQRIGRIHRLGQTEACRIYNLATEDTVEAHIVRLLHEKIRMFELVIGDLDQIVSGKKVDKLEEQIFEWSMNSLTDDELRNKFDEYGSEWTEKIKSSEETYL